MSGAYRFFHRLRVRWAECDMQGIVFNPHYLMYFDVAFTEYMRAIGLPYPAAFADEGTDTFMVSAQVDFRESALFDEEIDVGVRVAYFGTTSFRVAFVVMREGAVLVEGVVVYVNGDRQTRRPRALPGVLIAAVTGFEIVAPERKGAASATGSEDVAVRQISRP